jgi:hypothetical protein
MWPGREILGIIQNFVWGNLLENAHFHDREKYERIALSWIMGRYIVSMEVS